MFSTIFAKAFVLKDKKALYFINLKERIYTQIVESTADKGLKNSFSKINTSGNLEICEISNSSRNRESKLNKWILY